MLLLLVHCALAALCTGFGRYGLLRFTGRDELWRQVASLGLLFAGGLLALSVGIWLPVSGWSLLAEIAVFVFLFTFGLKPVVALAARHTGMTGDAIEARLQAEHAQLVSVLDQFETAYSEWCTLGSDGDHNRAKAKCEATMQAADDEVRRLGFGSLKDVFESVAAHRASHGERSALRMEER